MTGTRVGCRFPEGAGAGGQSGVGPGGGSSGAGGNYADDDDDLYS